jgi:hypothetical protein
MSADSVPSSKTNIFQNKLIYCRHFRTYSRCAMFDWSDTVFRRRNGKYIIIGRIFESEIILIPPSLKISKSSSNGSYRNTDEVWWRYGISRSCDEWLTWVSLLYTLIYCRHFRTYSRCAMFDWSDTVFRRRNVTRRRISNTVLQPRYTRRNYLKISESSSNGSYRNMDEVWWRYGISRSCDECNFRLFCSDDCRSLYLVKKSFGPMIAYQE